MNRNIAEQLFLLYDFGAKLPTEKYDFLYLNQTRFMGVMVCVHIITPVAYTDAHVYECCAEATRLTISDIENEQIAHILVRTASSPRASGKLTRR